MYHLKNLSCIVFASIWILINCQCTPAQLSATKQIPEFELYFGKTGGFTNLNPEYQIKSSGEILKRNSYRLPYQPYKKVGKSAIDSVYNYINQTQLNTLSINYTSNITYFIEIKTAQTQHRITWANNSQIPSLVKEMYLYLQKITN